MSGCLVLDDGCRQVFQSTVQVSDNGTQSMPDPDKLELCGHRFALNEDEDALRLVEIFDEAKPLWWRDLWLAANRTGVAISAHHGDIWWSDREDSGVGFPYDDDNQTLAVGDTVGVCLRSQANEPIDFTLEQSRHRPVLGRTVGGSISFSLAYVGPCDAWNGIAGVAGP